MATPKNNTLVSLSFEEALAELENIVRSLETGQINLSDSIAAYERGVALKQYCESKLKDAQLKIEQITLDPSGDPTGSVIATPLT
jgi:exodeoxyribonuclease VII small subunit